MRLHSIALKNIGPFDDAEVEFLAPDDVSPSVALLTGVNGTGKTIVLDAIRAMFGAHFATIERNITRPDTPFSIRMAHRFAPDGHPDAVIRDEATAAVNGHLVVNDLPLLMVPLSISQQGLSAPPWVVDFWRSQLASGTHRINALSAIHPRQLYTRALQGDLTNASVTNVICHIDYLRDSRSPTEKATGEAVYRIVEDIVRGCLLDGELVEVHRTDFMPIVRQGAHRVPLENVSSGNAYLIQRMISLLARFYSLHVLREGDPSELHQAPGLLLIDEAENHLHPQWQMRLIPLVRKVFPNLQIVAATHSPFVLASAPKARVYVCSYDPETRKTTIHEETEAYQNKAVDEILASPAFSTEPFVGEVAKLVAERKLAIANGDVLERERIETRLQELNPTYFGFLDLERKIDALKKTG